MDSTTILIIGGIIGLSSCLVGIFTSYYTLSHELIIEKAKVEQAQLDLLADLNRIGKAELERTEAGRELLAIGTDGLSSLLTEIAHAYIVGNDIVQLSPIDKVLKRVFDVGSGLIAILGIIILAPFLLLTSIVIKLDSPGPVIIRRRVTGTNGKQFNAMKFRIMYINSDEILAAHPELREELMKKRILKNDPRLTRVGRFLFKYALNELPLLFNVLKGDMSLLEPRKISVREARNFNIRNWTVGLNLQILVQTFKSTRGVELNPL